MARDSVLKNLILKARSYRRFDSSFFIDARVLTDIVDTVRFVPSGSNKQPLKYIVSVSKEVNDAIFSTLSWAASLTNWKGPAKTERPTGYIIILTDTRIKETADMDVGIAAQTIRLLAEENGLGGCMVASIDRDTLRNKLEGYGFSLPGYLRVSLILALGKPAEKVVLENVKQDGNIDYYRDSSSVHHVPKRKLNEVLIEVFE